MRNAVAVLQPTLFEGGSGGGAIYDAVSLNVSDIVSDIEISKEIFSKDLILYFSVGDSNNLAENCTGIERKLYFIDTLVEQGNSNMQKIGLTLLDAIYYAAFNK